LSTTSPPTPTTDEAPRVEFDLKDPIHRALFELVQILGSKGHDYSLDSDQFSNFRDTANHMDLEIYQVAEMFMVTKLSRLKALRHRRTLPEHESVEDTYKDLAAYAVLAYAMYLWQTKDVPL
jgi:hypothetical protein